jgi:hypothetical protein
MAGFVFGGWQYQRAKIMSFQVLPHEGAIA